MCVAFAAAAQQLSSVLLLRAMIVVGISFVFIPELSAEFLVYYCVHNLDGNMVLVVFVFMMQGQGKAQFGLYPSCTRRHAHPVGLRHAPSFQQFGLWAPVKLFSGSWFDSGSEFDGLFKMCSSGMMTDGVITDTSSGTVVDPSGMVLDGIFADTVFGTVVGPSGMVLDGIFADSVPGTVVRPSGMVLDGIFADTVFGTVVGPSGMVLDGIFADSVPGTVVRPSGMVLDGIFADPSADKVRQQHVATAALQQHQSVPAALVPRFQTQLWVK